LTGRVRRIAASRVVVRACRCCTGRCGTRCRRTNTPAICAIGSTAVDNTAVDGTAADGAAINGAAIYSTAIDATVTGSADTSTSGTSSMNAASVGTTAKRQGVTGDAGHAEDGARGNDDNGAIRHWGSLSRTPSPTTKEAQIAHRHIDLDQTQRDGRSRTRVVKRHPEGDW
jgi:hypothetical protein